MLTGNFANISGYMESLYARMCYDSCYTKREYGGDAVFGMCIGGNGTSECDDCPYYVEGD